MSDASAGRAGGRRGPRSSRCSPTRGGCACSPARSARRSGPAWTSWSGAAACPAASPRAGGGAPARPAPAGRVPAAAGPGPRARPAPRRGGDAHRLRAGRLLPQVNTATARVLAAEGCDVVIPNGQGCCGALSLHSGRRRRRCGGQAHDRDVRGRGCGHDRGQFGRLRLGDEGVRPAAGRRSGLGGARRALAARVRDFAEFLAELAGRPAASGIRCRSGPCITTPAISATRRGSRRSRGRC